MKTLYPFFSLVFFLSILGCRSEVSPRPEPFPEFRGDPASVNAAVSAWAQKGNEAIPQLRKGLQSDSVSVQTGARRALSLITGQWGGEGRLMWKRSLASAMGGDKPIMVLHLFGAFDEEFC